MSLIIILSLFYLFYLLGEVQKWDRINSDRSPHFVSQNYSIFVLAIIVRLWLG